MGGLCGVTGTCAPGTGRSQVQGSPGGVTGPAHQLLSSLEPGLKAVVYGLEKEGQSEYRPLPSLLKMSVGMAETGQEATAGPREEGWGGSWGWWPGLLVAECTGARSEGESMPHSSLRRGRRGRGKCGHGGAVTKSGMAQAWCQVLFGKLWFLVGQIIGGLRTHSRR